jgi:hypothetical protein
VSLLLPCCRLGLGGPGLASAFASTAAGLEHVDALHAVVGKSIKVGAGRSNTRQGREA